MIEIKQSFGNHKILLGIENIKKATVKGIRAAMYESGKDLNATAKKSILKKPKHGRVYTLRLAGRRVRHRSSAPGEAPANFTGSLRKAIDFKLSGVDKIEFGVLKTFNSGGKSSGGVNYGKDLEFGTREVKARPFLLPAIKSNYRNIEVRLNNHIEQNIKKDS